MSGRIVFSLRAGLTAVVGLSIAGALAAAAASAHFPLTQRVVDLELGRELFNERCANCHKLGGQARGLGPALDGPPGWATNRVPGMDAEEYIFQSIVAPSAFRMPGASGEMPESVSAGLSGDKLASVAAYVCSLSGPVNYPRFATLDADPKGNGSERAKNVDLASVERGRELYFDRLRCGTCHPLDDAPGSTLAAPSLLQAGSHTRPYLETSILAPSDRMVAGYETWHVSRGGIVHSGRRLKADDGHVHLLTTDAVGLFRLESFDVAELDSLDDDGNVVVRGSQSSMPAPNEPPTREDLDCLLDFLTTLR